MRAGVIGLGVMGTRHAKAWTRVPGVELVAVADRHPGRRHTLVGAAVAGWESGEEMLVGEDLDVVSIATSPDLHAALVLLAATRGAAVVVEKPLALTATDADQMIAALPADAVVAVNHVERHNPAFEEATHLLGSGSLGEVVEITARRTGPHPERARSSVVLDLAVHDLDLACHLLGDLNVVRASTTDSDERGLVRAELVSVGAVPVRVEAAWTASRVRRFTVRAEHGEIDIDLLHRRVTVACRGGRTSALPVPTADVLAEVLAGAAAAARTGGAPRVGVVEGARAVALAQRIEAWLADA